MIRSQLIISFDNPQDCAWALRQMERTIAQGSRLSGASAGILLDTLAKAKSVKSPEMTLTEAQELTTFKGDA